MNRFGWAPLGAFLLILSIGGILHGVHAEWAHVLYFQAKYGSAVDKPEQILRLCERAHRLYPFNYNLCILAAETAYYTRPGAERDDVSGRRALAEQWCGRGLKLNFYKSPLRLLQTRLLAANALPDAIRYWEAYVDWQFWAPFNHAVLVELYSQAGDFDKAAQSLEWLKGSDYYAAANRAFHEAWTREMEVTRPSGPKR